MTMTDDDLFRWFLDTLVEVVSVDDEDECHPCLEVDYDELRRQVAMLVKPDVGVTIRYALDSNTVAGVTK